MNISKDTSILKLLEKLQIDKFGLAIIDHWEADLCAIGIAKVARPQKLVYVSTCNKPEGIYDYECETHSDGDAGEYTTQGTGNDVNFEELLSMINRHLDPSNGR